MKKLLIFGICLVLAVHSQAQYEELEAKACDSTNIANMVSITESERPQAKPAVLESEKLLNAKIKEKCDELLVLHSFRQPNGKVWTEVLINCKGKAYFSMSLELREREAEEINATADWVTAFIMALNDLELEFHPAKQDGKPVDYWEPLFMTFDVENGKVKYDGSTWQF